jgi:hypothetical protein
MCWDQFVKVKHIDENKVTWREFKRYFQRKLLTKRYYDKKIREFFELNLGNMTTDEYERRFLELLKYVTFIKDEQFKVHKYLSGFPSFINENIQDDDHKTLEETIRNAKCLYDQQRRRATFQKAWEDKMKRKVGHRKKGTKPLFFHKNCAKTTNSQGAKNDGEIGEKTNATTYSMLGLWKKSYVQRFPSKR